MISSSAHTLGGLRDIEVGLDGTRIRQACEVKYSGIKFDPQINFKAHVSYVQSKKDLKCYIRLGQLKIKILV